MPSPDLGGYSGGQEFIGFSQSPSFTARAIAGRGMKEIDRIQQRAHELMPGKLHTNPEAVLDPFVIETTALAVDVFLPLRGRMPTEPPTFATINNARLGLIRNPKRLLASYADQYGDALVREKIIESEEIGQMLQTGLGRNFRASGVHLPLPQADVAILADIFPIGKTLAEATNGGPFAEPADLDEAVATLYDFDTTFNDMLRIRFDPQQFADEGISRIRAISAQSYARKEAYEKGFEADEDVERYVSAFPNRDDAEGIRVARARILTERIGQVWPEGISQLNDESKSFLRFPFLD